MNKKILLFIFAPIFALIILSQPVLAHCPLCTIAAGAGIGVVRSIGLDESIVGLFLGAFIASMGFWFNNLLKKRKIKIPFQGFLVVFASFLFTIIPLYLAGIIRNFEVVKSLPELSMFGLGVFGIDKLLFGTIIGVVFVGLSFNFSNYVKKKKGKVIFPYQGIIFMIITLIILSEVFWIINR